MRIVTLDSQWTLHAVDSPSMPEEARQLPSNLQASVPGDIVSDLLDAGCLPHPYKDRHELDCVWVGHTDWSLQTEFEIEEFQWIPGTPATITFEFLDTVAEIILNGTSLGTCQNMFRRHRFFIESALKVGMNQLEVVIHSPVHAAAQEAAQLPYPIPHSKWLPWDWDHRNLIRKVACHGGWDWGPTLLTGGIYEAPTLSLGGSGQVDYLRVKPQSHGENWNVLLQCEYTAFQEKELEFQFSLDGQMKSLSYHVQPGQNMVEWSFEVSSPELWWPAGQGAQPLSTAGVEVEHERHSQRFGYRTVEVVVDDDHVGRSMFFRVNGRDIFAKGANWIPVDAMPAKQSSEVYQRLLEDAVEANMNMIRLWGGGQFERDIFYNLCDELGLLVWHDMMFSCSLYPAHPRFLAEVEAEVEHQIKRLAHHPCIALWCGNNEDLGALTWYPESKANRDRYLVDYDRLNEGVVGRVVRELDPQRKWWPSSPSAGEGDYSDCWHDDTKGDMHYWSVWHGGLPFESYYDITPRFCSEFGFQSFPGMSTIESFAQEKDWNVTSTVMRHHQKNPAGNSIILTTMARYFHMPTAFDEFLWLSQVQQAWAIRTAVEYWRSQRPVSMGALYWQLNDLWPVASWSSIEYDGTWKLLHYAAKRFFAPLGLAMYKKDGQLQVHGLNDTCEEVCGELTIKILGFDGQEKHVFHRGMTGCSANSSQSFFSEKLETLQSRDGRKTFTSPLFCTSADDVVAEELTDVFALAQWEPQGCEPIYSTLFLTVPRDCEFQDPQLILHPGDSPWTLEVECQAPAFAVTLNTPVRGRFKDNGFDLLPGKRKRLEFLPENSERFLEKGDEWVKEIQVRSLNLLGR